MKTKRFSVVLMLAVLAAGMTAAGAAGTVLERVRKVEDPQLAELIEITRENYPQISVSGLSEGAESHRIEYENTIGLHQAIRTVTEKYAQIRLLDNKIEELDKKHAGVTGGQPILSELVVAKASLEAERLSCIAALREAMHLVPWTPFGTKEFHELKTWVHLEVLEDTVRVLNFGKPRREHLYQNSAEEAPLMTPEGAVQYVLELAGRKEDLPIRITFSALSENGESLAREMQDTMKSLIQQAGVAYETDLAGRIDKVEIRRLRLQNHNRDQVIELSNTRQGYPVDSYVRTVRSMLLRPGTLPMVIEIRPCRDELREDYVKLITGLRQVVEELGVEKYVQIVEPEEGE